MASDDIAVFSDEQVSVLKELANASQKKDGWAGEVERLHEVATEFQDEVRKSALLEGKICRVSNSPR